MVAPHRLKADPNLKLGDVTSVNVNVLEGGVQWNVVPDAMALKVDLRITLSDDHEVSGTRAFMGLIAVCVCVCVNV